MRQRILIAQAIMEEPDVLLLDEPTNGLDDSGVDEIRKLISAQAKRGAIVCVASHNKEDIALLSDKIFRVDNGAVRESIFDLTGGFDCSHPSALLTCKGLVRGCRNNPHGHYREDT